MKERARKGDKLKKDEQQCEKELTRKQKILLAALEANLGNVTAASRAAGVNSRRHYSWIHNPLYAAEIERINNLILDFTECALHKQIQRGNIAAIIFKLKCLGKSRGYIEKQYVEANLDVSKLSDADLLAIVNSKGAGGAGTPTKSES